MGERRIATDEQLLVGALSGLLMTMIASNESGDTALSVSAELRGNEVIISITDDRAGTDLPSRIIGSARVVAGIGGTVTIATDSSTRVLLAFPVAADN